MIRGCTDPQGRPGYCWQGPNGLGECHPYNPASAQSRSAAVRAALRDGAQDDSEDAA